MPATHLDPACNQRTPSLSDKKIRIPMNGTVVPGEGFFLGLDFWISLNIFRSMYLTTLIFVVFFFTDG